MEKPTELQFDDADYNIFSDGPVGYSLNIYGKKKRANAIGVLLGERELLLQLPTRLDPRVGYLNPQYLSRDKNGLTPCMAPGRPDTSHGDNCVHQTVDPTLYFSWPDDRSSSNLLLRVANRPGS